MKKFDEFITEGILLGKTVHMGTRTGRIVQTIKIGSTSRYDDTYLVKFQDGTKIEMHDVQIRPFLEENGAGEEGTDELDDKYREDTPGEDEQSDLGEDAPANSVGGGMSPHFGGEGEVQGTDGGLTADTEQQDEQFAGVEVFDLSPDEYQQCVSGRDKYERWSRKLNMEDGSNQTIRRYSHKNPDKDIIVRDSRTGMMAYLKRK